MLRSPVAPARLVQRVSEKTVECGAAWTSPGGPQGMARKQGPHPGADMPSIQPSLGAGRQSRVRGVWCSHRYTGGLLGGRQALDFFFLRLQTLWENANVAFSELTSPACGPALLSVSMINSKRFYFYFLLMAVHANLPTKGIACLKGHYSQKLDTGADKHLRNI